MKRTNSNIKLLLVALVILLIVLSLLFFGIKSLRMYNITSSLSQVGDFELLFTSEECYDVLDQELKISSAGSFVYKQTRFIENVTEIQEQIPQEVLSEVLYRIIYDHDFFKLDEDLYDGGVSDGSTVYLYIRIGDKEKRVGGYASTFHHHEFRKITEELLEMLKPYYAN